MFQVTQRNGRRWRAADAFLRPALGRPNLEVITGAHVTGLELSESRVVGINHRTRSGAERVTMAEWVLRRSGKLTSSGGGGLRVRAHAAGLPAADIQFHMGALYAEEHGQRSSTAMR